MPNVTWEEPRILVDLLALCLYADHNSMELGGPREVTIVSPWLSDVELNLGPSPWHQNLTLGETEARATLLSCLAAFLARNWTVRVVVLEYGPRKPATRFDHERRFLKKLLQAGGQVFLSKNLHAKGVVTPLALITGSTNVTMSGLWEQTQNALYFAHDHDEYEASKAVLLGNLSGLDPITGEALEKTA